MLGSPVRPAVAFATTHSQRFASFFLGLSELEVADFAFHWGQAHFGNYDLQRSEGEWTEMGTGLCSLPVAWLAVGTVIEEGGKNL